MLLPPLPFHPQICDIVAICELAHAAGALVCVDNSILTCLYQNPLDLGADISMTSATKFIGGHSGAHASSCSAGRAVAACLAGAGGGLWLPGCLAGWWPAGAGSGGSPKGAARVVLLAGSPVFPSACA